jgi:predicted porin
VVFEARQAGFVAFVQRKAVLLPEILGKQAFVWWNTPNFRTGGWLSVSTGNSAFQMRALLKTLEKLAMKKSLIALAALAASAAFAQSTVTLYGYGDIGIGTSIVATGAANKTQLNPNTFDVGGLRFGMKGSEDLGGGLKANFQLESDTVNGDTGAQAGGIFTRATWVGLSGDFGAVQLGRQSRASLQAAPTVFGWRGTSSQGQLGLRGMIDTAGGIGASSRYNAAIRYDTPTVSGLKATVQYVNAEDNSNASITDFTVVYANGPVTVAAAQAKAQGGQANKVVSGSYDFGVATLIAGYIDPAGTNKGYTVGAKVPMGAVTLGAEYTENTGTKKSGFELGADYALSKRTALTAATNKTDGMKSGFFAGVRHAF